MLRFGAVGVSVAVSAAALMGIATADPVSAQHGGAVSLPTAPRAGGWVGPTGIDTATRAHIYGAEPQVRVAPDGRRAVAYWAAQDQTVGNGQAFDYLRVSWWTAGRGWSKPESVLPISSFGSIRAGAFQINADLTVAAVVGEEGATGKVAVRSWALSSHQWSGTQVLDTIDDVFSVSMSEDGRTVMASLTGRQTLVWHPGQAPTLVPIPVNASVKVSADGSSALGFGAIGRYGVYALWFHDGAWGEPQSLSSRSTQVRVRLATAPDLSNPTLVWCANGGPSGSCRMQASTFTNGSWLAAPADLGYVGRDAAYGIDLAATPDASKLLLVFPGDPSKATRHPSLVAVWRTSKGWAPATTLRTPGVLGALAALSSSGDRAVIAADIGRSKPAQGTWVGTARAWSWNGRSWTGPAAIGSDVWSDHSGQVVSLAMSADGKAALLGLMFPGGGYSCQASQWLATSGWGARHTLVSHDPRPSCVGVGLSADGSTSFAIAAPSTGKYAVVVSAPK